MFFYSIGTATPGYDSYEHTLALHDALPFCVVISVFDRHIEPFDGSDNQIEIEPLVRAGRRVPGDGGCWRRVEVYEALDIFIIIIEQVDIGPDLPSPEVPL